MIDHADLERKRKKIDAIRRLERDLPGMDAFRRGQLAGAQQVLYWATGQGMEPVRAILTDEQIAVAEELTRHDERKTQCNQPGD